MKSKYSIIPAFRVLVICFLFLSFVSSTLCLSALTGKEAGAVITKKLKDIGHTDSDFPAEEKENESRSEHKNETNLIFYHVVREYLLLIPSPFDSNFFIRQIFLRGNLNGVPLYLAKRSLLI